MAEGRTEGRTEGKLTATIDIATSMLKNNYSIKEVSKITGLSQDELKKIDISKDNK